MLYLVAFIPPLAVLLCGKPFQALLNVGLTLLFYVPGLIHAMLVVNNYYADRRTDRLIKEQRQTQRAILATAAPRQSTQP